MSVPITVEPAPNVTAGDPISVCEDALPVQLKGRVNAGTVKFAVWTGYEPGRLSSATDLNALFTPDASQIGTVVVLTLNAFTDGLCSPPTPQIVRITVLRLPCTLGGTSGGGLPIGAIVGIAVGGALLVGLGVYISVRVYRRWATRMDDYVPMVEGEVNTYKF